VRVKKRLGALARETRSTMRLWRVYKWGLQNHPYTTGSITTGFLMGTGDVVAQKIVEEKRGWDKDRTKRFVIIGVIFFGPVCTHWYRYLDKLVPRLRVPKAYAGLVKTGLDQALFAPSALFFFLNLISSLRGETMGVRMHEIKTNYPSILMNNYKFWPWIQLANFYFVPLQHRLMVVNLAALCWNTYLSWKTNDGGREATIQELLPELEVGHWTGSNHERYKGE